MAQSHEDVVEMNDNEIYVEMKHVVANPRPNPEPIRNEAPPAPPCAPTWRVVILVVSLAAFATIVAVLAERKAPACPACPVRWMRYNKSCYFFSNAKKNWTASRDACAAMRSHLLAIRDFGELDFFQRNIKELRWIGLRKKNASAGWSWEGGGSGIVPKVTSNSVVQECGVMLDGGIRASSCSVSLLWICKKYLN